MLHIRFVLKGSDWLGAFAGPREYMTQHAYFMTHFFFYEICDPGVSSHVMLILFTYFLHEICDPVSFNCIRQ